MRVAAGRDDLEDALMQLQNGDVERATAKVVHGDDAVGSTMQLVQAIGQRGRGRLIHQAQHLQPGDAACILRRLSLRIVEIGRNGDDRLGHRGAEETLGVALQLQQNVGRDLRRRQRQTAHIQPQNLTRLQPVRQLEREQLQLRLHVGEVAPHQPFHGIHSVFGVLQQHVPRRIPHGPAVVVALGNVIAECHHTRHDRRPILARNHGRLIALHIGHQRICRTQVDANHAFQICHCHSLARYTRGPLPIVAGKPNSLYRCHRRRR